LDVPVCKADSERGLVAELEVKVTVGSLANCGGKGAHGPIDESEAKKLRVRVAVGVSLVILFFSL